MNQPRKPGLLVSVRSEADAAAALAGGADIIDVKEPARGPLGRADDETIRAVLDLVAGRRPVSAALGELVDGEPRPDDPRLSFVKWGLAKCNRLPPGDAGSWQKTLNLEIARRAKPQAVIVAYADWQCAQAPPIHEVIAVACGQPGNVVLIDTYCKESSRPSGIRPTLLDWVEPSDVAALCEQCHAHHCRVALAGSLTTREIESLHFAGPDWFAVRGAVCAGGDRDAPVSADKVRQIAEGLAARRAPSVDRDAAANLPPRARHAPRG